MTRDREERATRRLGKFMVVASWLVLLALLTAWFNGWFERRYNPNREVAARVRADGVREVVLEQNHAGHYVATGAIDGVPVVFLLDTGATAVSVPAGLAARLGLERGPRERVETANGTVTTYATRLARVQLGSIELTGVRAHINPHAEGSEVLLGMSFLRGLDFSQRDGRLTLRQAAPGN